MLIVLILQLHKMDDFCAVRNPAPTLIALMADGITIVTADVHFSLHNI